VSRPWVNWAREVTVKVAERHQKARSERGPFQKGEGRAIWCGWKGGGKNGHVKKLPGRPRGGWKKEEWGWRVKWRDWTEEKIRVWGARLNEDRTSKESSKEWARPQERGKRE